MRSSKYKENLLKIIENTISRTGSESTAYKLAGISSSTFYMWKKCKPEFLELIMRAHERFTKLNLKERTDLYEKAIDGLEYLLTYHDIERTSTSITEKLNTKGELKETIITTKTKEIRRDPSFKAIEKVLGRREIKYFGLHEALDEEKRMSVASLFQKMFGEWGQGNPALKGIDESTIFSDTIDLIKLRQVQAETQLRYDQGVLPFEEWEKITRDQAATYVNIYDKIERRAMGLIEGYTPLELINQITQFVKRLINNLIAIVNDISIDRADIPDMLSKSIREKTDFSVEA